MRGTKTGGKWRKPLMLQDGPAGTIEGALSNIFEDDGKTIVEIEWTVNALIYSVYGKIEDVRAAGWEPADD